MDAKSALSTLLSNPPIDAPPTYAEVVTQLTDQLADKLKEDPKTFYEELSKAFNEGSVDKLFVENLEGLVDTAIVLQKGFDSVGVTVEAFDIKQYKKSDGSAIPAFKSDWDVLGKIYLTLMWDSRKFATRVKARVESYRTIILPMLLRGDKSNEEKIKNLDFFLNAGSSKEEKANQGQYDLTADENEAERISTGFTKLRADVGSFCVRLKQAVTDAELGMQQEVTNLQAKVNELQAKLDGYTTARNGFAIGAGVGVVVAGFAFWGGMAATGILAPIALVGAAITALVALGCGIAAAVEHFKLMADAKSELEQAKVERDAALARQTELLTIIKPQIEIAEMTMNNICEQLGTLASIFTHIRADAQSARDHLSDCLNDDVPALFKEGSITLATAVYKKLDLALHAYAVGFDKAKVKPLT